MKKNVSFLSAAWRPGLIAVCLGVIAYILYFHNATQLVPGFSSREIQTYRSAADWHLILQNPVNAPYTLVLWLTIALGHHGFLQTRLVAAGFGVIAVLLFYAIVYHWHGTRTALLGTLAFATSAGFLHSARLGSPLVLQMAILLYVAAMVGYRMVTKRRALATYVLVAVLAVMLYVPGMFWIVLVGLLLNRRGALHTFKITNAYHRIAYGFTGIVILSPLIIAIVKRPSVGLQTLGLPPGVSQLEQFPANLTHTIASIGLRSTGTPDFFVGHAPFLSIVGSALFVLGFYTYTRHLGSPRAQFLLGSMLISIILIGFGGLVGFSMLLPVLYLYVTGGVHKLLGDWLRVFPRNPIAKYTGIGLVCVMLLSSVLYQTRSYFVAWPHAQATRDTFRTPQP